MDIRRAVEATPEDRNRTVDLARAVSISLVVLGHWLAAAVWVDDGVLRFTNILELASWTEWLTWIVQVIPVFFIAGGYANLRSFRSARRRGVRPAEWIVVRFRRLLTPVVPFLLTWLALVLVTRAVGVDPGLIRSGSLAAVTPLWFLAVYLLVIAAVPVTLRLWERFGWWSIVAGTAAAVVVDVARAAAGQDWIGWSNYVFVWFTAHQLGYLWADEERRPSPRALGVGATVAVVVLIALTVGGVYPISMVGIPGATRNNTLPPTAALLALTAVQYFAIRAVEPVANRFLRRTRPWTVVVSVQAIIMTLYLWHLTALALVVLAGYGLGVGFGIEPLSAAWWWTRPVWLVVLAAATWPLLWVFGRFEHRVRPVVDPPAPWLTAIGVVATIVGIAFLVVRGVVDAGGHVRWELVALVAAGVVLVGGFPAREPEAVTRSSRT